MTRRTRWFLALLLFITLAGCQGPGRDEGSKPEQIAMVALHDLSPEALAADGECARIGFSVEMESGAEDLKAVLGIEEASASSLMNFIERKAQR